MYQEKWIDWFYFQLVIETNDHRTVERISPWAKHVVQRYPGQGLRWLFWNPNSRQVCHVSSMAVKTFESIILKSLMFINHYGIYMSMIQTLVGILVGSHQNHIKVLLEIVTFPNMLSPGAVTFSRNPTAQLC